jgi:lysophospholipase L1-like esterase
MDAGKENEKDSASAGKKRWFGVVLILVIMASMAATLMGGELYCRRLYGTLEQGPSGPQDKGVFFVFSPELGWRGAPHVSSRHGSGVWVTQNERGFRDTPWDLETTKRRVLLLGDSNMWGYGVGDDEYPAALLNRGVPSVRWFNAGMNGYATDQQYLLFKQLKPIVRPDLTVLVYCGNDRSENMSQRVRGYNKPFFTLENGRLEARNIPVPAPPEGDALWVPVPDRMFDKTGSYLLYHVSQIIEARKSKLKAAREKTPKVLAGTLGEDPTEAIVKALNEEADRHFLLVLISADEGLTELCRRENIPLLDMSDTPAGQPGPNTYPGGRPKYGHWTPRGNRAAAELIGRAVMDRLGAP